MKLNVRSLFLGATIVAAVSYVLCALFVALAPGDTSRLFSFIFHIDLTGLARHVTWPSFLGGLVSFSIGVGAHVAAAAWLANRLSR
jgi:hypothetical protein